MFVVPLFRPRIGKQNHDVLDDGVCRQVREKESGLGLNEANIGQAGARYLAIGAFDPVARDVDTDVNFFGKLLRISRQKMPMTTSDFPDKRQRTREYFR